MMQPSSTFLDAYQQKIVQQTEKLSENIQINECTFKIWEKETNAQFEQLCGYNISNSFINSVVFEFPSRIELKFDAFILEFIAGTILFWDGEWLQNLSYGHLSKIRNSYIDGLQVQYRGIDQEDDIRLVIKNNIHTMRLCIERCEVAKLILLPSEKI